ncbi:conserved hypothetical protein (plasmid) [Yersinia pestis KIM D27]|uniref:Uncharacterized protein n=1 Tax=Yersinia pestis Java 9 TaxID=880632 RepID=E8PSQ6_YERPE|nr:hypothetical protein YpAngola_B0051 [Yersinia pestis Angola]ADW67056.1 hypothetical protein YPJ_pCD85 [Yersinia pestis Java 9]EFA45621.1 conserved hypothetical protein [Yersinia pestis KIM D27]
MRWRKKRPPSNRASLISSINVISSIAIQVVDNYHEHFFEYLEV